MQRQNDWCLSTEYRNCRYFPRDGTPGILPPIARRGSRTWLWLLIATVTVLVPILSGAVAWAIASSSRDELTPVEQSAVDIPTSTPAPVTPTATVAPTPTPASIPTTPASPPSVPIEAATPPVPELHVHAAHGRLSNPDDPRSERLWLDTGIVLVGSPVTLSASGFVSQFEVGPGWPPQGNGSDFCQDQAGPCAAPRLPQFALIGLVEGQTWPILIGDQTTIVATGRLYLAFNDGYYEDNCLQNPPDCGQWTVTIDGDYLLDPPQHSP